MSTGAARGHRGHEDARQGPHRGRRVDNGQQGAGPPAHRLGSPTQPRCCWARPSEGAEQQQLGRGVHRAGEESSNGRNATGPPGPVVPQHWGPKGLEGHSNAGERARRQGLTLHDPREPQNTPRRIARTHQRHG